MNRLLIVALACLFAVSLASKPAEAFFQHKKNPCRRAPSTPVKSNVHTPLQHVQLPDQWLWSDVNGTNLLTVIKNQHVPQYCGSCWAQAAASSLSDRIKIARNGAWPDINIAPQVFVSCSMNDDGCHGGFALSAYEYATKNYVTDETCAIYHGRGHDNGYGCSNVTLCRDCKGHEPCFIPDEYHIYQVDQYGEVKGEEEMK